MQPNPIFRLTIVPDKVEAHYWGDLLRYKELFYILAWRDLKVRYKQTLLGVAWSIVRPLATMVIFTLVFSKAANMKADDPSVPYGLFVMAGILPWQFFANAVGEASNSLLGNAGLLSKVYFPRLIIPASAIITAFVDFLITLIMMVGLFAFFGFMPSAKMIFLPLFMLLCFLASLGISLFITALNVKYRDFRYIIPFIVQFGLYISPVGFGTQTLTSKLPAAFQTVFMLNPMVGVIDGFRWCCFDNSLLNINSLLFSIGVTIAFLILGISTFRKMERGFADLI
jgi:lipopolysaccharide transport system permease protein